MSRNAGIWPRLGEAPATTTATTTTSRGITSGVVAKPTEIVLQPIGNFEKWLAEKVPVPDEKWVEEFRKAWERPFFELSDLNILDKSRGSDKYYPGYSEENVMFYARVKTLLSRLGIGAVRVQEAGELNVISAASQIAQSGVISARGWQRNASGGRLARTSTQAERKRAVEDPGPSGLAANTNSQDPEVRDPEVGQPLVRELVEMVESKKLTEDPANIRAISDDDVTTRFGMRNRNTPAGYGTTTITPPRTLTPDERYHELKNMTDRTPEQDDELEELANRDNVEPLVDDATYNAITLFQVSLDQDPFLSSLSPNDQRDFAITTYLHRAGAAIMRRLRALRDTMRRTNDPRLPQVAPEIELAERDVREGLPLLEEKDVEETDESLPLLPFEIEAGPRRVTWWRQLKDAARKIERDRGLKILFTLMWTFGILFPNLLIASMDGGKIVDDELRILYRKLKPKNWFRMRFTETQWMFMALTAARVNSLMFIRAILNADTGTGGFVWTVEDDRLTYILKGYIVRESSVDVERWFNVIRHSVLYRSKNNIVIDKVLRRIPDSLFSYYQLCYIMDANESALGVFGAYVVFRPILPQETLNLVKDAQILIASEYTGTDRAETFETLLNSFNAANKSINTTSAPVTADEVEIRRLYNLSLFSQVFTPESFDVLLKEIFLNTSEHPPDAKTTVKDFLRRFLVNDTTGYMDLINLSGALIQASLPSDPNQRKIYIVNNVDEVLRAMYSYANEDFLDHIWYDVLNGNWERHLVTEDFAGTFEEAVNEVMGHTDYPWRAVWTALTGLVSGVGTVFDEARDDIEDRGFPPPEFIKLGAYPPLPYRDSLGDATLISNALTTIHGRRLTSTTDLTTHQPPVEAKDYPLVRWNGGTADGWSVWLAKIGDGLVVGVKRELFYIDGKDEAKILSVSGAAELANRIIISAKNYFFQLDKEGNGTVQVYDKNLMPPTPAGVQLAEGWTRDQYAVLALGGMLGTLLAAGMSGDVGIPVETGMLVLPLFYKAATTVVTGGVATASKALAIYSQLEIRQQIAAVAVPYIAYNYGGTIISAAQKTASTVASVGPLVAMVAAGAGLLALTQAFQQTTNKKQKKSDIKFALF